MWRQLENNSFNWKRCASERTVARRKLPFKFMINALYNLRKFRQSARYLHQTDKTMPLDNTHNWDWARALRVCMPLTSSFLPHRHPHRFRIRYAFTNSFGIRASVERAHKQQQQCIKTITDKKKKERRKQPLDAHNERRCYENSKTWLASWVVYVLSMIEINDVKSTQPTNWKSNWMSTSFFLSARGRKRALISRQRTHFAPFFSIIIICDMNEFDVHVAIE